MDTAEIEVFPALTGELHSCRKPERLRPPQPQASRLIASTGAETQREAVRPGQPPGIK
jgi:hypothetical protein